MMPAGQYSDSDSTLLPLPKSAITLFGGIFARLRGKCLLESSSLYTCRVFITDNYDDQNTRATEVPGCCRVTCLLLAVIGTRPQGLILQSAIIVNDYSPRF